MIPRSRMMGGVALLFACALHAAAMVRPVNNDGAMVEGGGQVAPSSLGSSFANLAEGVQRPVPARQVASEQAEPERAEPVEPVETSAAPVTSPIEPSTQHTAPTAVEPRDLPTKAEQAVRLAPIEHVTSVPVSIEPAPVLVASVARASAVAPSEITGARAAPLTEVSRQEPAKLVEPAEAREDIAPIDTPRPPQRPEHPAETKPAPPKPAPTSAQTGNSSRNARVGTAEGTRTQPPARASTQGQARVAAPGNAAVTNYKGQVRRKIFRTRTARVSAKGEALVSLKIAASGQLAAVNVARSSGSAQLDRAALRQVQRAAPFPPPPTGKPVQFSIEIQGR